MKLAVFIPCFIDQLYPQTGLNMVHLLERAGHEVAVVQGQSCCGQPGYNAGYQEEASLVARKWLADFEDYSTIVIPSASCCGMIHNHYPALFKGSASVTGAKGLKQRVVEFSSFWLQHGLHKDLKFRKEALVTYHDSCSGLRELGIKDEPRAILRNIEGTRIVEMPDTQVCCGFGGTFAVKFKDISVFMGKEKMKQAHSTESNYLISTDISCLMHLSSLKEMKKENFTCMHLVDYMADSLLPAEN